MDAHSSAAETTPTSHSILRRVPIPGGIGAFGVLAVLALMLSTACSTRLESTVVPFEMDDGIEMTTVTTSVGPAGTSSTSTSTTTTVTTTTTTPVATSPETIPRPDPPAVDWLAFEESLFAQLPRSADITAAVVFDGDVIWTGTRGQADPSTRFRIASLSKILTAVVLMQLVDEGLVGLDEPIGQRVADQLGLGAVGPAAVALTPSMLLSHRSGFDKYRTYFFSGPQHGDFRSAAATGLQRGPGRNTSFVYSNMNYVIAGVLIEALTGQDYQTAVYERLLTPLGITTMRLAGTNDVQPGEMHHVSGPDRNYMELLGPAGAWVGTASDMATILSAIAPDAVGIDRAGAPVSNTDRWRALSPETWLTLLEPLSFGPLEAGAYGRGVMYDAIGAYGHTGSIENTRTMGMVLPNGLAYTVLINANAPDRASAIGERVRRAFESASR